MLSLPRPATELKIVDVIALVFKIVCVILATSMIGFWIHKYQENEDVSVIEYESIESMDEVIYPELTICIARPFIVKTLHEFDVTRKQYNKYLKGVEHYQNDERFDSIPFMNATIDIFDHLQYPIVIGRRNGTNVKETYSCINSRECQFVKLRNSFNGVWRNDFYRCYSINVKPQLAKYVKIVGFAFNLSLTPMLDQISGQDANGKVLVVLNHPHQFLRNDGSFQYVLQAESKHIQMDLLTAKSIEVLKRRNKGGSCVDDWKHYDDLVLSKHLQTVGCDNPYQYGNNITCVTPNEKLQAKYRFGEVKDRYYPAPCQEMSNIAYDYQQVNHPANNPGLQFTIVYPDKMKIISQARSVDFHTLIGNIGGYIGLFLGMLFLAKNTFPYQYII